MDASQPSKNVKVFSDMREVNIKISSLIVLIVSIVVTAKIILQDTYKFNMRVNWKEKVSLNQRKLNKKDIM